MLYRTRRLLHGLFVLLLVAVVVLRVRAINQFANPQPNYGNGDSTPLPVICRDGWTMATTDNSQGAPTHICIKINSLPLPWEQSRDVCRSDNAFLLKLEKRVKIGLQSLEEFVEDENLQTFWTGVHEDGSKLLWDEISQSIVQANIGFNTQNERRWKWNTDSLLHVDGKCGVLSLNYTVSRNRRSLPSSDFDEALQARPVSDTDVSDASSKFKPQFLPPNNGMANRPGRNGLPLSRGMSRRFGRNPPGLSRHRSNDNVQNFQIEAPLGDNQNSPDNVPQAEPSGVTETPPSDPSLDGSNDFNPNNGGDPPQDPSFRDGESQAEAIPDVTPEGVMDLLESVTKPTVQENAIDGLPEVNTGSVLDLNPAESGTEIVTDPNYLENLPDQNQEGGSDKSDPERTSASPSEGVKESSFGNRVTDANPRDDSVKAHSLPDNKSPDTLSDVNPVDNENIQNPTGATSKLSSIVSSKNHAGTGVVGTHNENNVGILAGDNSSDTNVTNHINMGHPENAKDTKDDERSTTTGHPESHPLEKSVHERKDEDQKDKGFADDADSSVNLKQSKNLSSNNSSGLLVDQDKPGDESSAKSATDDTKKDDKADYQTSSTTVPSVMLSTSTEDSAEVESSNSTESDNTNEFLDDGQKLNSISEMINESNTTVPPVLHLTIKEDSSETDSSNSTKMDNANDDVDDVNRLRITPANTEDDNYGSSATSVPSITLSTSTDDSSETNVYISNSTAMDYVDDGKLLNLVHDVDESNSTGMYKASDDKDDGNISDLADDDVQAISTENNTAIDDVDDGMLSDLVDNSVQSNSTVNDKAKDYVDGGKISDLFDDVDQSNSTEKDKETDYANADKISDFVDDAVQSNSTVNDNAKDYADDGKIFDLVDDSVQTNSTENEKAMDYVDDDKISDLVDDFVQSNSTENEKPKNHVDHDKLSDLVDDGLDYAAPTTTTTTTAASLATTTPAAAVVAFPSTTVTSDDDEDSNDVNPILKVVKRSTRRKDQVTDNPIIQDEDNLNSKEGLPLKASFGSTTVSSSTSSTTSSPLKSNTFPTSTPRDLISSTPASHPSKVSATAPTQIQSNPKTAETKVHHQRTTTTSPSSSTMWNPLKSRLGIPPVSNFPVPSDPQNTMNQKEMPNSHSSADGGVVIDRQPQAAALQASDSAEFGLAGISSEDKAHVRGESVHVMNLNDCNKSYPSICFSEPVRALRQVSFCGIDWVGHQSVDRCYKVLTFPLKYEQAKQRCRLEGGALASLESDYYGNLTTLAYLQFKQINRAAPSMVWVNSSDSSKVTLAGGCPVMDGASIRQYNCNFRLVSVCQKPAGLDYFKQPLPESLLNRKQLLTMRSTQPQPLVCPIPTSSTEERVMWFKDNVAVQDSNVIMKDRRINPVVKQQRAKTLFLDGNLLRRLTKMEYRRSLQVALLQGNYWCQVWRLKPFHSVKSPTFLVLLTDVITLHGTLQTDGVAENVSILFNYMNHADDIVYSVEEELGKVLNNVRRMMRVEEPGVSSINLLIKYVNSKTGVIEFYIHLSLVRDIGERYKERVVSTFRSLLQSALVPLSRDLHHKWNLSRPVTEAITLRRIDVCQPQFLRDTVTGFGARFPGTKSGQSTNSVDKCDGVPVGFANCRGDYETGAYWESWQVTTDCSLESTDTTIDDVVHNNGPPKKPDLPNPSLPGFDLKASQGLDQLDEIEIEDGNVIDVTNKMAEIIDKTSGLDDHDIETCAEVIDRVVQVAPPADMIGHRLLNTVNRILDTDESVIKTAQMKTKAATRILDSLEKYSMKTNIGNSKSMRLVTPNVAMEVWDLDPGMTPVIGLGAHVGESWDSPLSDPHILTIRDRSDAALAKFDVAIELPPELIMENMKENSTRLSMLVYRKTGLFTPVVNSSLGIINSAVISATLGGKRIQGLKDMIKLAFRPMKIADDRVTMTRCGFWDFSLNKDMGGWSSSGCRYSGIKYGLDICLCDHLTNFAVLLDFYGHSKPLELGHELTLSIISLVGLSLSILGLALTVVTFIFFKKLRQGRAQQTLFHMVIALLCSKVVFLVGIKQTHNEYFCLSVAVILHYLILVSFLWMLVEAILQYMTFVKILGTYVSRYALKTAIPAWGLPLIPVICVLSIDYNMYRGHQSYCWMGMEAFYFAFALPVGVIIVFNVVMFVIILISLVRRPDGLRSTQSKERRAKVHFKAAVTIFMLLGLTWIFGFLQIEDARVVFQYLFTVFSTLQGFFIFVLLVARRKQVRDQWSSLCCTKDDKRHAAKQVSPTNSNSTSSNGSNGLSTRNNSTKTLHSTLNRGSFDSPVYYIPPRKTPSPYRVF